MANSPNGLGNAIELKVILGLNDKPSQDNLNAQIAQLQKKLDQVKIDIKIDPKAISALERLATLDFSKLTKEFKSVEKEAKEMATVSADEITKAMKIASDKLGMAFKSAIKGSITDVDALKKELNGLNATIKVDYDIVNGKKELNKLKASIEKEGKNETIEFEKVIRQLTPDKTDFVWMPKVIQETDKQLSNAAKSSNELIAKMNKLLSEGKITTNQFTELANSIKNAVGTSGFSRANQQLNEMVAATKSANKELINREQIEKRLIANQQAIQKQVLAVEKTMKTNAKTVDMNQANELLVNYQKLNPASKDFKQNLFDINTQFTRMKTVAAEASRSSMGIMDSFRVAMEKFPIWINLLVQVKPS